MALFSFFELLLQPLQAQDDAAAEGHPALPRVAVTQPPSDDLDFTLMGEYVGLVASEGGTHEPLGLQLRPLGPSNFEALQFIGGLPGQEGFKPDRTLPLIGRRFEQHLVLSGGPWALWVQPDHCKLFDSEGNLLGRLDRVDRGSSTMGARPPQGAVVLFDGRSTEQFTRARMTEDGLLMAGADVLPMFQDFNLHVEFQLPYMPNSEDQSRGNSGCYLLSRYEVQILDSFAKLPAMNGAASLYRTKSPDVNMSLPPLIWQTYDIKFTAPRWGADGSKIRAAHLTVWHNGVKVQDDVEVPSKTGNGREEEPNLLPIRFQFHNDPVLFRNIWIIDRGLTDGIAFPVLSPTPEQLEAERIETERLEAERIEAERIEAERLEAERIEAERIEAKRIEAERLETERVEAEQADAEKQNVQVAD